MTAPVETPAAEAETAGKPSPPPAEAEAPKGNKEAKYRTERNDARTERDALAERVATLQTREVERLAGDLAEPGDLLTLSGKSLADLLDDAGEVDPEAVAEAVADVLAARPGLRRPHLAVDPSQGHGNTAAPKSEPTWGALLKG